MIQVNGWMVPSGVVCCSVVVPVVLKPVQDGLPEWQRAGLPVTTRAA